MATKRFQGRKPTYIALAALLLLAAIVIGLYLLSHTQQRMPSSATTDMGMFVGTENPFTRLEVWLLPADGDIASSDHTQ
jgi:hypothetical protein